MSVSTTYKNCKILGSSVCITNALKRQYLGKLLPKIAFPAMKIYFAYQIAL